MKFYRCTNCNEIVIFRNEGKVVNCCEEAMIELLPNQNEEDSVANKPIIRRIGNLVTVLVGTEPHSMVDVHYIDFILLETNKGIYYKKLSLDDFAIADFLVHNKEEVVRAYAYCSNHFLWMTEDIKDYNNDK